MLLPLQSSSTVKELAIQIFHNDQRVLEAVMNLERRNFSKRDSWAGIMTAETKRHNTSMLYASKGDKTVGYILVTTTQLKAHISKVAVDKAHRRQGIARRLVQECLDRAVELRGVICATLHVDPANAAAKALYLSLGFTCDGILEDYYAPNRPCWKMLKEL